MNRAMEADDDAGKSKKCQNICSNSHKERQDSNVKIVIFCLSLCSLFNDHSASSKYHFCLFNVASPTASACQPASAKRIFSPSLPPRPPPEKQQNHISISSFRKTSCSPLPLSLAHSSPSSSTSSSSSIA